MAGLMGSIEEGGSGGRGPSYGTQGGGGDEGFDEGFARAGGRTNQRAGKQAARGVLAELARGGSSTQMVLALGVLVFLLGAVAGALVSNGATTRAVPEMGTDAAATTAPGLVRRRRSATTETEVAQARLGDGVIVPDLGLNDVPDVESFPALGDAASDAVDEDQTSSVVRRWEAEAKLAEARKAREQAMKALEEAKAIRKATATVGQADNAWPTDPPVPDTTPSMEEALSSEYSDDADAPGPAPSPPYSDDADAPGPEGEPSSLALSVKAPALTKKARTAHKLTKADFQAEMLQSYAGDDAYSDGGGGGGGGGSIMDMLREMMMGQVDDRKEIHGPRPVLSEQNEELLAHLAEPPNNAGEMEMGYYRYPDARGDKLVFVSEGNIWVANVKGGHAARVSASYSAEGLPKLSADGVRVAFLAQSVDGYEVFVMPVAGGVAQRVSHGSQAVKLEGWTKEGTLLVVTTFFSPIGMPQLATVDIETKSMTVLPFARASGGTQDEQGCYVFYPLRQTSATKRYEGGEQSRLWRWCRGWHEAQILTPESWSKRGAWNPMTSELYPGKIFFLSDFSGVTNIWVMNLDGSDKAQVTKECGMDIMEASIDDKNVVYRLGSTIYSMELERDGPDGPFKAPNPKALQITLISEFRDSTEQQLRNPLEEIQEVALSEDGMYAALVVRGQIYFTPLLEQLGKRIEKVTKYNGAIRYRHVQFVRSEHPEDNLKLIAMSDATGEYEYVILERAKAGDMGGLWNETALTTGNQIRGVMSYSTVSPDASSLVFDDTYGKISVLNLSTTAVNTFDYKTEPAEEEYEEDSIFGADYEKSTPSKAKGGAQAKGKATGKAAGKESWDPFNRRGRQSSKLHRKRRALRRETRTQFRRDAQLKSILAGAMGIPSSPASASPSPGRALPKRKSLHRGARHMHHTRYGAPPLQGGYTDLFGSAHLGTAGPLPKDMEGTGSLRSVMQGLRPQAAGDYSWSPDGKWLAFSASDWNEFSCVHVWNVDSGEVQRLTHPSYNAVEPKFSPDGLFLYYFSDQQISSGADSPYGMRGSEPTIVGAQQLMCLPLREGFRCPFFLGDELNSQGQTYDPSIGKKFATKVSTKNVEKRAVTVPFLEKRQYTGLHIIGGGNTFLMQMWDGMGLYLIALDIISGQITPIYPDALGVFVSGDTNVVMLAVEQGLALLSSKVLSMPGITQEQVLGSAVVWAPPEGFTVMVNPREEWMQMYNDAMRNMRDAFYDPNMHGVDWKKITEMYRPLVYRVSTKAELRDVLNQAFGELSVLHVFVSVRSESPVIPVGQASSCLGGNLVKDPKGLRVVRVFDTSDVLAAPDSPLSATAVDLRPGDIITRVDGQLVNKSSVPISHALLGKAGMQVLLEVDQTPRDPPDPEEDEIRAQMASSNFFGQTMMGGAPGADPDDTEGAGMGGMNAMGHGIGLHHAGHGHVRTAAGHGHGAGLPTVAHLALAKKRRMGGKFMSGDFLQSAGEMEATYTKGLKMKNETGKEAARPVKVGGLKSVVVTPMSRWECSELRSADALNARRNYVRQRSNDSLGYIYLEDMEQMGEGSSNSFDDFAAQFYPAIRKAGLIIDVRRNAGGNIDTWILERLRRVAWMFNTERSGPGDTTMQYAFQGKVAVLVDEMTSSDAEIFAAGIQRLKLGKVIGMRSWGGAVGYSSNSELSLVDGSGFTIPSFGPYVGGEWMIEQKGVVPDITVENPPVSSFNGHDKQLDVAVEHLLGLIKEAPKMGQIPVKPKYPDWSFDRDVCSAGRDGTEKARLARATIAGKE